MYIKRKKTCGALYGTVTSVNSDIIRTKPTTVVGTKKNNSN